MSTKAKRARRRRERWRRKSNRRHCRIVTVFPNGKTWRGHWAPKCDEAHLVKRTRKLNWRKSLRDWNHYVEYRIHSGTTGSK